MTGSCGHVISFLVLVRGFGEFVGHISFFPSEVRQVFSHDYYIRPMKGGKLTKKSWKIGKKQEVVFHR